MYPRSPPTAGEILEFSQFGKDLFSNVNQLIQPLSQVLHVSGVDPTVFIGGFGILVQVVAAHLQEVRHAAQFFQVQMQAIAVQCHIADLGTQASDAHTENLFIDTVLFCFAQAQDDDFIPLLFHRASPSLS